MFSKTLIVAACATLFANQAMGKALVARTASDRRAACNGHNNYGFGHSCAFNDGMGGSKQEGWCITKENILICSLEDEISTTATYEP